MDKEQTEQYNDVKRMAEEFLNQALGYGLQGAKPLFVLQALALATTRMLGYCDDPGERKKHAADIVKYFNTATEQFAAVSGSKVEH